MEFSKASKELLGHTGPVSFSTTSLNFFQPTLLYNRSRTRSELGEPQEHNCRREGLLVTAETVERSKGSYTLELTATAILGTKEPVNR